MIRKIFALSSLALVLLGCQKTSTDVATFVDPFIGTANGGNTLPGASVPWGMVINSPHNDDKPKWSGARYFHGQNTFYGFGQIHLSGVGCGDLANIVVNPLVGKPKLMTSLTLSDENAVPGFYTAKISNGVVAELTATERTSLSKFKYPDADSASILINVSKGLSPAKSSYVKFVGENEVEGFNQAGGFCYRDNNYTIYFVARFNKPASAFGTFSDSVFYASNALQKGTNIGCYLNFNIAKDEEILMKIGVSYVSIENARLNLETEQPGWEFDNVKASAYNAWNTELGKILVEGGTEDEKTSFYTALYHTLIHPNIIDDVNGEYPAMKTKETMKVEEGRHQYTVYSLWDTYRTLHPLMALVWPERQMDMVRTMVDMAKHGGDLPFWELGADETYVMNGDPAPLVVVDSYFKGLKDFDTTLALNTMLKTAFMGEGNKIRPMNKYFIKHGYIPWDDCGPDDEWGKPRMVSECLEYAFADWAVSEYARQMGAVKEADSLAARSLAYKHYYNHDDMFLRPRMANGDWYEPFEPFGPPMKSMPGFVEGNSWQYTFFVPHDILGLRDLMGSNEAFVNKLQMAFDSNYFTVNNEPDIAYPYLFTYIEGEEWRTPKEVHKIMKKDFGIGPAGLPGNDDAGTISGWYIFSAMGFYPDVPGKPVYRLSTPLFDKVTIHLNKDYYSGNQFILQVESDKAKDNIKPISMDGEGFNRYYLNHSEIVDGGVLVFE